MLPEAKVTSSSPSLPTKPLVGGKPASEKAATKKSVARTGCDATSPPSSLSLPVPSLQFDCAAAHQQRRLDNLVVHEEEDGQRQAEADAIRASAPWPRPGP